MRPGRMIAVAALSAFAAMTFAAPAVADCEDKTAVASVIERSLQYLFDRERFALQEDENCDRTGGAIIQFDTTLGGGSGGGSGGSGGGSGSGGSGGGISGGGSSGSSTGEQGASGGGDFGPQIDPNNNGALPPPPPPQDHGGNEQSTSVDGDGATSGGTGSHTGSPWLLQDFIDALDDFYEEHDKPKADPEPDPEEECRGYAAPPFPIGENPEANARLVYDTIREHGALLGFLAWFKAVSGIPWNVELPVEFGAWAFNAWGQKYDNAGNYNYALTGYVMYRTILDGYGLTGYPDTLILADLLFYSALYQQTLGTGGQEYTFWGEDKTDVPALLAGYERGREVMKRGPEEPPKVLPQCHKK